MKGHAGASREAGGSRDAGERKEQMLRAALEVIVERGYADTRIADVAERTGTSPALRALDQGSAAVPAVAA